MNVNEQNMEMAICSLNNTLERLSKHNMCFVKVLCNKRNPKFVNVQILKVIDFDELIDVVLAENLSTDQREKFGLSALHFFTDEVEQISKIIRSVDEFPKAYKDVLEKATICYESNQTRLETLRSRLK